MFAECFENVRSTCPLIHNITNYVTVNDCANMAVSYTHLRAHETEADLVCRLLLEKKKRVHESDKLTPIAP